jgi:hypothetical protein
MPAPRTFDRIEVVQFPSPGQQASVLKITRDPSSGGYDTLPEGTLLTDLPFLAARDAAPYQSGTYRLAKIVFQQERHLHDWFFVNEREDQEAYNFEFKYLDEASSKPLLVRTYVTPRSDYTVTVEGTADPVYDDLHLIAQEQVRTDDPIFDSLFVVDRRTYTTLPGVVMDGARYGDRVAYPRSFLVDLETVTEEQKVLPGTPADKGSHVIESTVVPETKNLSIRKTEKVDPDSLPKTTVGYETDRDGQLVTVTRTINIGSQTITPSATVEGSVDPMGGGITLLEHKQVPEVFDGKTISISKPDTTPAKFVAEAAQEETAETLAGTVAAPVLGSDEEMRSEERTSKHTIRRRIRNKPAGATLPVTLTGQQTGTWGEETVTEQLKANNTLEPGHTVLSHQVEPIGNGRYVGRKVQVSEPVALVERRYDADTKVALTITKTLVPAGTALPAVSGLGSAEIQPIDKWNSIQIVTAVDIADLDAETYASTASFSYPDELNALGIDWDTTEALSNGSSGVGGALSEIVSKKYSWSLQCSASSSMSVTGALWVKIINGHSGPVRTTVVRSYHSTPPNDNPSIPSITPVFGTVTLTGFSITKGVVVNVSGRGATRLEEGKSFDSRVVAFTNSMTFGPVVGSATLSNAVPPSLVGPQASATTGSLPGGGTYPVANAQATAKAAASLEMPASSTVPSSHIIAVNVEKWRFGIWVREIVTAYKP